MPANSKNSRNGNGGCYIGRITNEGAQRVEAPVNPGSGKGKHTVHTGRDLRTGRN